MKTGQYEVYVDLGARHHNHLVCRLSSFETVMVFIKRYAPNNECDIRVYDTREQQDVDWQRIERMADWAEWAEAAFGPTDLAPFDPDLAPRSEEKVNWIEDGF